MKAYLDSGIFLDYLIGRGHAGPYLRTAARRGRTPAQLGIDAEECLKRLAASNSSVTSSLTCYEVDEAMYRELKRSASGVTHSAKFIIPASRAVMTQTLMTIETFGIQVVDLTPAIVLAQCQNVVLQMHGIRAADALHVTTAMVHEADLVISSDDDVLSLSRVFNTTAGKAIHCVDTDAALTMF